MAYSFLLFKLTYVVGRLNLGNLMLITKFAKHIVSFKTDSNCPAKLLSSLLVGKTLKPPTSHAIGWTARPPTVSIILSAHALTLIAHSVSLEYFFTNLISSSILKKSGNDKKNK